MAEGPRELDVDISGHATATVVSLELKKAIEIFGEAAFDGEDTVVVISYQPDEETNVRELVMTYRGRPHPKSRLYQYVKKYGIPAVGQRIEISRNTAGFWDVDL